MSVFIVMIEERNMSSFDRDIGRGEFFGVFTSLEKAVDSVEINIGKTRHDPVCVIYEAELNYLCIDIQNHQFRAVWRSD